MRKHIIPYLLAVMTACGSPAEKKESTAVQPDKKPDTTAQRQPDTTNPVKPVPDTGSKVSNSLPGGGLVVLENIEMTPFCVLRPEEGYLLNRAASDTKGKFVFTHKTKKDNEVVVQGLMRSNTGVSLEEYYKNSYEGQEEEGKIIQTKELLSGKNCFYFKGYYSNLIYTSRFIEIVWLRPEDVVTYSASFDITDTAVWNSRLKAILQHGSECGN